MVGIISRLRHSVPLNTLIQIYRSLIFPYTYYGFAAWGQAAQVYLRKVFILQKRALRLMFFAGHRSHAIPLFVSANILPLNMLYFETVCSLMHDISTNSAPQNICDLFTYSSDVHTYNTRFSDAGMIYMLINQDWEFNLNRFPFSEPSCGIAWSLPNFIISGCLHDTGATFAPERVHSGSLSWLYICLHDTTTKCYAGASHPGVSSPQFSHRGENFTPVRNLATVSCKRETTTHFGVKSVCR